MNIPLAMITPIRVALVPQKSTNRATRRRTPLGVNLSPRA
jgi:hypothetical protein